ncbi:MAG: hypothetical protein EOP48_22815 [Sphingobacteriales bacterium]|nr:MAG: hypothetical protein EOP48_22815 [Sphingobacteriales bacterium]
MNQGNEIFKTLLQEAYDTHRKIEQHENENDSLPSGQRRKKLDPHLERKLFLLIVGILTFIGVEPVKVIFRKNLGPESFNMFRLVLAAFLFLILGLGNDCFY